MFTRRRREHGRSGRKRGWSSEVGALWVASSNVDASSDGSADVITVNRVAAILLVDVDAGDR